MATTIPLNNIAKSSAAPETKNATAKETVNAPKMADPLPVAASVKPDLPKVAEETKKEPVIELATEATKPVKKTATFPTTGKNFNGGIFKSDYDKQTRSKDITGETGAAGVFKSTSGWEDGKYYCLHNTSSPGTIVKVTNSSTGKSVYAKVLDIIPDMEQNNGILIRLSNAAAAELGTNDTRFDCSVNFSK